MSLKATALVMILILAVVFVPHGLEGQDAEPLVLILAGQSNMVGQGSTSELPADEP